MSDYNIRRLLLNAKKDDDGRYRFTISTNLIYKNLDLIRRLADLGLVYVALDGIVRTIEILDKEAADEVIAMEDL